MQNVYVPYFYEPLAMMDFIWVLWKEMYEVNKIPWGLVSHKSVFQDILI